MPFTQTPLAFTWENLNDTWSTLFNTWLGEFGRVQIQIGESPAVDITENVFRVFTSRGRNRDLQRTNAGSLGASLRNETRLFDPKAGSPLEPVLKPRVPVVLKIDGQPAFTGIVNDWDFEYDINGQSVASISCSDAFAFFAQESTAGSAIIQDSGDRVNEALDNLRIAWPTNRRIVDVGNTRVAAGEYQSNALQYLQALEESEGGLIFINKFGDFVFQQRLLQPETTVVEFTDDGSGVPYESVEITFGTDLLANDVRVFSVAGSASAVDVDSRSENGVAELQVDSLLAGGSLQGLADYLLARFGRPEYRISAITVNIRGLSTALRSSVLQLDLGSQVDVSFTPNRVGNPLVIRSRVTGISHDISIDQHKVTFNFEELGGPFFILDDADAGKLDNVDFTLGF